MREWLDILLNIPIVGNKTDATCRRKVIFPYISPHVYLLFLFVRKSAGLAAGRIATLTVRVWASGVGQGLNMGTDEEEVEDPLAGGWGEVEARYGLGSHRIKEVDGTETRVGSRGWGSDVRG